MKISFRPMRFVIITFVILLAAVLVPQVVYAKSGPSKVVWANSGSVHTITVGEDFDFNAKVYPSSVSGTVKYKSSNKSVATVTSKGVVKGISRGKCTITATTKAKPKKSVKCTVYVGTKATSVEWNNTEDTRVIYVGKKFDFNTTVYPTNASFRKVKYSIGNSNIATVTKEGVVRAKSNGTTHVTATTLDGTKKTVTCTIKVKTRVADIKLSSKSKTCFVNDKRQIKSRVTPSTASDKTVAWTSEDPSVATVDESGTVTGVSSGVAEIKAEAEDGSGKTKTYKIYVRGSLSPSEGFFIAHRGYSGLYPENTLEAVRAASGRGFGGVEIDFWACKNDTGGTDLMIMHDGDLNRMCGADVSIKKVNLANRANYPVIYGNGNESGQTYLIPTVQEFLDAMKYSGLKLEIEMKDTSISTAGAQELLKEIHDAGVDSQVVVTSANKKSLVTFADTSVVCSDGTTVYGKDINREFILGVDSEADLDTLIKWAHNQGLYGVNVRYSLLTQNTVDRIHDYGMKVTAWVVKDRGIAADMIRMGVDSITLNNTLW
ncbi:MAG: Ig-like domain-containing protein [Eubacteriaceae bacterium]|nr:Ig-like domain-containing protein [Eubacteriaceae bacterium]